LRRNFALARTPPVKFALNVGLADVDLRWTTIDHDADAAAMRLTKARDAKELAECVAH